jgi:hypothetical protein
MTLEIASATTEVGKAAETWMTSIMGLTKPEQFGFQN